MHISVPLNNTMEFIDSTEVSPLISHCSIKVCYVGQDPNRNHSVITKEVATDMGRRLPGSPIVGFYNQKKKDYEGHNRELVVQDNGKIEFIDTTKAYGFVPTNAKVWFQNFVDDGITHEYLCTEGYIWTAAYPEAQRIIQKGNNQSMEINDESARGYWANDDKSGDRIFIYNEALVEKLCVLGEDVEPCFEGASINANFALENIEVLKNTLFSMITELQEVFKGGSSQMEDVEKVEDGLVVEEFAQEVKEITEPIQEEPVIEETFEEVHNEEDNQQEETPAEENIEEQCNYAQLESDYATLQASYSALEQENAALRTEVESLRQFKLNADRQAKQAMIDSFYMLSDEDKADVVNNIDNYSLDDIEAKLSIICVRNRVSFSLDEENKENVITHFRLQAIEDNDSAPAWVKAVRQKENN